MAESPIKITRSDEGLSVRYEFDAHYVSDEDVQRILGYIDQLETKNAKLLESNKKWMGKAARFEEKNEKLREQGARLFDKTLELGTENAKLRELVRIAIEYCVNGYCAEEDECPLYESRHSCNLYAKARELGIEV